MCANGTLHTYAVKMKDKKGNVGTESTQLGATTAAADTTVPSPNPPTFSSVPKGISTTAISMTATKASDDDETVLYKFTRVQAPSPTSGWTSSCSWTDTGLTPGNSYTYTLQVKDGHGNMTSITTSPSAVARDDTPPPLDTDFRLQWGIYPYTQLDKTVRLSASNQAETANVEYYYECVEQPSVNSGWTATQMWVTPAFTTDGTYNFRFKLRDTSPQHNESSWSATKPAKALTTNTYHDYTLAQLAAQPDSTLVRFSGKVTVTSGTSQTFTITPDTDYIISDVLVDGVSVGAVNAYAFTNVTDNHTIEARFEVFSGTVYTITASSGTGGTISPLGEVTVPQGTDRAFTITPSAGYTVRDVKVDGVSQGALRGFTFSNVTANHTISATFAPPAAARGWERLK